MTHPYPPVDASERETLVAYLDYYRAVVLDKAGGLNREQLSTRLGPSTLTLINIVHHLAIVEHWWFHEFFLGNEALEPWSSVDWEADRDWEFTVASELDPTLVIDRYREAIARSQGITDAAESVEVLSAKERDGKQHTLRWILVHMIEETARHAGHADLIRESIDGKVGDFRDSGDV